MIPSIVGDVFATVPVRTTVSWRDLRDRVSPSFDPLPVSPFFQGGRPADGSSPKRNEYTDTHRKLHESTLTLPGLQSLNDPSTETK